MTDTMTDTTTSIYEGLFLFPQSAVADLQGALDHINTILDRAGAEVIALSKWDERRLAYDVQGNRRGLFFLAFFRADRSKIAGIERDCNLSELLLRALVTRADQVPSELIETAEGRAQLADEITMRQKTGEKEAAPVQFERASDKAPAAPAAEATAEAPAEAPAVEAPATEAEAPAEAPAVKAPATEAEAPAETEAPTETPAE